MNYDEFEELLKTANLDKTKFAEMNQLNKHSVFNWKQKEIPGWVKPCLENYIKAQKFDEMIETANKLK